MDGLRIADWARKAAVALSLASLACGQASSTTSTSTPLPEPGPVPSPPYYVTVTATSVTPQVTHVWQGRTVFFRNDDSRAHFAQLCAVLDAAGVTYRINERLVRGLDYYGKTVFEWTTDRLGAQGTVCAGGRYDGLVEQLGGKPTPAVGFAMGMERLVLLLETLNVVPADIAPAPHVYTVAAGAAAEREARLGAETFAQLGSPTLQVPLIAESLWAQGRYDEADAVLGEQSPDAGPTLPAWQVRWRIVSARLLLARKDARTALDRARESATHADATDDLVLRGDAYAVLARAQAAAGAGDESARSLQLARELYARKQATAVAARLMRADAPAPLSSGG